MLGLTTGIIGNWQIFNGTIAEGIIKQRLFWWTSIPHIWFVDSSVLIDRLLYKDGTMVTLIPKEDSPVKLTYSFLKLTGAMNQEGRPWSLIYAASQFVFYVFLTIGSGLELFWGGGDLQQVVTALSSFSISLHVITKVVTVLLNQTKIRQLLDRLEEVHNELLQDEDHRHIIVEMERFSRFFLLSYRTLLLIYPFLSIISNFIIDYRTDFRKPHLILQLWVPWPMKDLWSYVAGALFVLWPTFVSLAFYVSFTSLELVFTFEMTSFLKVLQARLKTMRPNDKYIYRQHKDIIQLIKDFNNLFSGQIYWEIIVSSVQPCGFGFTLIKSFKRKDPGVFDLIYKIIMVVTAPFILCACGQEISTEMEKLHEASYMSPWHEQTPQMRRNLIQLMMVTVRPTAIGYRGIIVYNYGCFTAVIQGIYSYLMMINHFESDA